MSDYSKLSDMEINGRVLHRLTSGHAKRIQQASVASGEIDYCNSWADAGPIAEKNRIGTMPSSGGTHMAWDISGGLLGDKQAHSEKICRAICIVYLMMNEGE